MAFKMYRFEVGENLSETYTEPEKLILSGLGSPLAAYVKAVKQDSWSLSEIELVALAKPGVDIHNTAILFEAGSDQPGHITLYRLVSLHGRSTDDSTEMIAHFKILLNNKNVGDLVAYRPKFTIESSLGKPDIYENLKLSGGTRSGTWRWMEIEQILNAGVMTPK